MLARKAARPVRAEVDSAYESRLRLLITFAGLPDPVINHCIVDGDGRTRRRLDLSYPHLMLAVEYDGRHHIVREDQWHQDIARREELESAGWRFIIVTSSDLHQRPLQILLRISGAIGVSRSETTADQAAMAPVCRLTGQDSAPPGTRVVASDANVVRMPHAARRLRRWRRNRDVGPAVR